MVGIERISTLAAYRRECPTRAAPRSPEIDQHDCAVDNGGLEISCGDVLYSHDRGPLSLCVAGIGEFAECGVGAGAVDGGGSAVHQDADADCLGGLLFGGAGASGSAGV